MEQEPMGGQVESFSITVIPTVRIAPGYVLALANGSLIYEGRWEKIPREIFGTKGVTMLMSPRLKRLLDKRVAENA